jgi:circadian clock protein KaiC
MSTLNAPAPLVQLPTGVPGLDEILGGGIPEYSCTLLAGGPGTGKTTLAQQVLFANCSSARPGVFFTGPGQSSRKLLNHQQQLTFFDTDRVNRSVHLVTLSQSALDEYAEYPTHLVDTIQLEVEERRPSVVVVDLVRALMPPTHWAQLALYLARCEATSILIGDCDELNATGDAARSIVDNVLLVRQIVEGEATTRAIQVLKVRGQEPLAGLHNLRLTWDGVQIFPRWPTPKVRVPRSADPPRLSVGIDEIDDLLGGGVPAGDALLAEGPSGTGKSVLATHFIAEGGIEGEPGVAFLFEERPDRFIERAEAFDLRLERLISSGLAEVLSFRGRDMAPDEVIDEMHRAVTRVGARRVVIDSVASLELVLSGSRGVRDCLWRLLDSLTGAGLTVWLNSTPEPGRPSLAPLVDDVLVLQRVEHETWVENRLGVMKMRWGAHTRKLLSYEIHPKGLKVAEPKAKPAAPAGCLFDVPMIGIPTQNGETLAAAS